MNGDGLVKWARDQNSNRRSLSLYMYVRVVTFSIGSHMFDHTLARAGRAGHLDAWEGV